MKLGLTFVFALLIQFSNRIYSQTDSINFSNRSLFILDGHNHQGFSILDKDSICFEMSYLKNLGYDAIVYPLPINRSKKDRLSISSINKQIQKIKELSLASGCFQLVDSISDMERKIDPEGILFSFSIEYFHGVFDIDLNSITEYKNSGIAYITLIDSFNDDLFVIENSKSILTKHGKDVIDKMNTVNIKIDISHLTESQMLEVIDYSKAPVMASFKHEGDSFIELQFV